MKSNCSLNLFNGIIEAEEKILLIDKNLYYIGGVVRDKMLGVPSIDTDLCYEGNAIEFAKVKNLEITKENPAFGTVRVLLDGKETDIASTRTETYPRKGHLPKVENIGCPLIEDLKRRDFTINAMAQRTTDGELIDYFNGRKDIKNKTIRVLHDKSFIDDPSRIIRALKFSVRFSFELDSQTKALQEEYLNNINYDMSYSRIRKELIETFGLNSAEAFDKFVEEKIYKLLGENILPPEIKGEDIKNALNGKKQENIWFMYIAPFLLCSYPESLIPLTRAEKRILDWTIKLKTQKAVNNTPAESIILRRVLDNA